MNRTKIIKYRYLANIFIIIPGVMIKLTGMHLRYSIYIFRKRVCNMASSWFHGKVYSIKFVSGLQSVDDGFSMYSGLLNQEN